MKFFSVRRLRSLFIAVLFLFSFTTISAPKYAGAQQIGKAGHEFDYYSDATHRTLVGFVIFCKNGQTIRSGSTSQFVVEEPAGC
ncbi:MAG TPA: hypothetical protein VHA06_12680 [Candidatus Angelobacter sp.]|jgi:hypothetical protein|nr:hypothetical protein [Candidatus Angelobacter sp.]